MSNEIKNVVEENGENACVAMVNPFVYARKFRVVLAAEGVGIFDNDNDEFYARETKLWTILQSRVFWNEFEAVNWAVHASLAYAAVMLGEELYKFYAVPVKFEVNSVHTFSELMVKTIGQMKCDSLDNSRLKAYGHMLIAG